MFDDHRIDDPAILVQWLAVEIKGFHWDANKVEFKQITARKQN